MATMSKIREMSPYLLAAIAVLFIGFMVIADMDPNTLMSGSRNPATATVGEVNGEPIAYLEFSNLVSSATEQQRRQLQQSGQENAEVDDAQVRDQVWNQLVNRILMQQEAEKLGITVTDEEIRDVLLENPPQNLKQQFTDTSGVFQRQLYLDIITNPNYLATQMGRTQKDVDDFRQYLLQLEDGIRQERTYQKLQDAINLANGIPPVDYLKQKYVANNSSASVDYIAMNVNAVADNEIQVSDAEIQEYYNKHKERFKQPHVRSLRYVSFPVVPSGRDSNRADKKEEKISKALREAPGHEARAKKFDELRLEYSGQTSDYELINEIPEDKMMHLANMQKGDVVGPVYLRDGKTFLKLEDRREGQGNMVARASHILIKFNNNKDSARAEAEKVKQKLADGADFAATAREFSQDQSANMQGGDLGYFTRERMVKPFSDAVFAAKPGDLLGPVETNFGYHIISVTDLTSTELQYSEISINPTISNPTRSAIFRLADQFRKDVVENGVPFDSAAKRLNLTVNETPPTEESRAPLGSRALGQFAFEAELGAVSEPVEVSGYGRVVCQLSDIIPEGIKTLDAMRAEIQSTLSTSKKLDVLVQRMQNVYQQVKGLDSLKNYQSADSTLAVKSAPKLKQGGNVPGMGNDRVFTTKAYSIEIGKISEPIRGEQGCYIVQVLSRAMADESGFAASQTSIRSSVQTSMQRQAFMNWLQEIRKKADITDKRSEFFRF